MSEPQQQISHKSLSFVEKGNTFDGVNRWILSYFLKEGLSPRRLLDIPCGHGQFLRAALRVFRECDATGVDLYATPPEELKSRIRKLDAKDPAVFDGIYDVVTCISGVMVFDDVSRFFERASRHLTPGGWFVVTNDNVSTAWDRLRFLIYGRVKSFRLLYEREEPNWNVVLPQALLMLLEKNGFQIREIRYLATNYKELLFLPLAWVVFPFQCAYVLTRKSHLPKRMRLKLFPFRALFCRHYVIIAEKK